MTARGLTFRQAWLPYVWRYREHKKGLMTDMERAVVLIAWRGRKARLIGKWRVTLRGEQLDAEAAK